MGNLITGLNFMLIGMGGVFLFLLLLVVAMNIMHRILRNFGGADDGHGGTGTSEEENRRLAAAIAAAYHKSKGNE